MYIKSVEALQDHPHGEAIMKAMNRHIAKKGAEFCYFLPSHMLKTGEFMRDFQKSQALEVSNALAKYSPFETRLLMHCIEARDPDEVKKVTDRIRNANRLTSRFIAQELERIAEREKPLLSRLKTAFTKNKDNKHD